MTPLDHFILIAIGIVTCIGFGVFIAPWVDRVSERKGKPVRREWIA